MRNTSICGATETLLIHKDVIKKFGNPILKKLQKKNCIIYGDKKIKKAFDGEIKDATSNSWNKEYLSAKISVKVVNNTKEAIDHINKYGTRHTDAIITKNKNAEYFLKVLKAQSQFIILQHSLPMEVSLDLVRGRNFN